MVSISTYDAEPTGPILGSTKLSVNVRTSCERPLRRRRRVRFNYPASLVQLAIDLQHRVGMRRTAGLLGLQLSTLYRWVGHHNANRRRSHSSTAQPVNGAVLLHLPEAAASHERPRRAQYGSTNIHSIARNVAVVEPASDGTRDRIMVAKALLDQQFVEPWTCARLAGRCGMSRLHFIRMFARHVGVPPYQYLTRVRVARARELSMEPNRPLRTIAREVGFRSVSSLHRAFHRYLGAPPGELFNRAGNF